MKRDRRTSRHPKITVGYVRVSTENQAQSGVSLDAQEARIRAFALATDRTLAEVIIDHGISAKTLVRPGSPAFSPA